jgi:hypothetical protein
VSKDTGGSAFPVQYWDGPNNQMLWPETGMTLRDWFASQMLPRIGMGWPNLENRNLLAKQAYEMADAMIEERNKK